MIHVDELTPELDVEASSTMAVEDRIVSTERELRAFHRELSSGAVRGSGGDLDRVERMYRALKREGGDRELEPLSFVRTSSVAVSRVELVEARRRASAASAPLGAVECPWEIAVDSREAARRTASELYGTPAIAPLVTGEGDRVRVVPDLLLPKARAEYEARLARELAGSLDLVADASLRSDDESNAVIAELLERWSEAPTAAAARFVLEMRKVLPEGWRPASAEVEAKLVAHDLRVALERGGSPQAALQRGAAYLLAAIDQPSLDPRCKAERSRDAAGFVGSLPPSVHAGVLLEMMKRGDRIGEPTPEGVLFHLFEKMEPADRERALASLCSVLSDDQRAMLLEGRDFTSRHLPWSTHYGALATSDYAEWSHASDSEWSRGASSVGGAFAAAWTPETAAATALTLAAPGALGAITGKIALLDAALLLGGTFMTAFQTTIAAQEALTGKDAYDGRALRPEEKLQRILAAGSGTLLLGAGFAVGFQAGSMTRLRLSPGELRRLNQDCVKLEVPNLPPEIEVWVPKASPLARAAEVHAQPRSGWPPRTAGLPAPDGTALQSAKSAAGAKARELARPHLFTPAEKQAMTAAVDAAAKGAAYEAFMRARAEGKSQPQSNRAATRAAKDSAAPIVHRHAVAAAEHAAERAIQDGSAFALERIGAEARAMLDAYRAGTAGQTARALAPTLDGMSEAELLEYMEAEVKRGTATVKSVEINGPPPQRMNVWEYADGTVVRYKPKGDEFRDGPSYSVEVKSNPRRPDLRPEDAAFKVDAKGRPIPKGPNEMHRPYRSASIQDEAWEEYLMSASHRTLR